MANNDNHSPGAREGRVGGSVDPLKFETEVSNCIWRLCRTGVSIAYPECYNGGGSRGEGRAKGSGDGSPPPSGVQGKTPVGDLGDEVSQKLKQNVKLAYNF